MEKKIKAGIAGAAGYTGGELLRLLLWHPNVEIVFAHSNSNAGKPIYHVHTDLLGDTNLFFASELSNDIDVLFLCMGHGDSKKFLEANTTPPHIKIIDLSQDFRLKANAADKWVYGLPELNRDQISSGNYHIANPGCFATCIQLALLPLAKAELLQTDVHINATTGSTGAGQSPNATGHFSWRANNLSVYKAFEHQHLNEIGESLLLLQPSLTAPMNFVPQRGNFTRGIHTVAYTHSELTIDEALLLYTEFYKSHPFVHLSLNSIDLKQVVNTNKCLLHIEKHGNMLMITSIIDNLLKGASGQAVQNMNLVFGFEETAGLKLKPVAF